MKLSNASSGSGIGTAVAEPPVSRRDALADAQVLIEKEFARRCPQSVRCTNAGRRSSPAA